MALEGTFSDFGLAEIFQLVGLQKKTGVLTVRSGTEKQIVTVSFDSGMITFADEYKRSETERLGSILIRAQLITEEALEKAIETQKQTLQRLGHVLVQMGFLTKQELRRALQTQVKETVYRLFRWKEGSYQFSPEPVTYDKEMYQPVSAEFLLMEGVRMIDEWPIIEKKITSFDLIFEKVPGREPATEARAEEPGAEEWDDLMSIVDEGEAAQQKLREPAAKGDSQLSAQELLVYNLVDGVRTVQELIDVGKIGEFETCKILYSFISVGLIRSVGDDAVYQPPRSLSGHRLLVLKDTVVVIALVAVLGAALLFNPWSFFALNYNAQQSRKEIDALRDDVKVDRLHYALQVFYLEKQSYPYTLEKLTEDKLLKEADIRSRDGQVFDYWGGEQDYKLTREETSLTRDQDR